MKKGQLKALFIEAKGTGQKYIGVMIQTEGSSEPEVIINPKENFNAKFDYYMAAYDDDLILVAAKGKKDIRITGAAAGASFEDIQSQLIDEKASSGWKEQIADAVDRVVDKMLKETPPETEEERQNCETMRETIKGKGCMSSRVGAYRTGVLIMGKSTSRGGFSETKRTANMFSRWIFDTFSRVLTMMS